MAAKKNVETNTQQETTKTRGRPAKVKDAAVVLPIPPPAQPPTVADKLWAQISSQPVEVFGLPGKALSEFCTRCLKEVPDMLFLKVKASSIIVVLEEVCAKVKLGPGEKIKVEPTNRYIQVSIDKEF